MNLPIIEPMTYISPSSFQQARNCLYSLYLERLSGLPRLKPKIERPAAIGILFETFLQDDLKKKLGLKYILRALDFRPEQEWIDTAKKLVDQYIDWDCAKVFLDAKDLQLQKRLYKIQDGVPILGVLDAIPNGIIHDFKTRGFGKNPTTPTPGYTRRIHFEHGPQPPHPDLQCLVVSKHIWADQMCFYSWLNGTTGYVIHEICNTTKGIVFVEHKGTIPKSYQDPLWGEVKAMWEKVNQLSIDVEPNPTKSRCERYGSICNCAINCHKYMETLGDDNQREFCH